MIAVRSRRVVCPDSERPASIIVDGGLITRIEAHDALPRDMHVIDVGALVVSPGVVDSHVHINEPGRTEWEGFDTATRAAAAGGVTTVVDMPLNSIPATTTMAGLRAKRDAARDRSHVDVGFWGGIVPDNASDAAELEGLIDLGVRGFKCFLVPSGVDEFRAVTAEHLRAALPVLAHRDVPLLVHAELPEYLRAPGGDPREYATYLATRPAEAERRAVALMIGLAAEFRVHVHIVHVSASETVDDLARARAAGVRITAETCPHYLTFSAEDIQDGATPFKCAPPLRDRSHRDALWRGLTDRVLDLVASDHSPAPPAIKCTGDFVSAWGGIPSLELSLPATWTAARDRRLNPVDLARLMSSAPAALAGLSETKGAISVGRDADFVVWDPDATFTVDVDRLQQRHKITPYAGRMLTGVLHATFLRGERVWDGRRLDPTHKGHLL